MPSETPCADFPEAITRIVGTQTRILANLDIITARHNRTLTGLVLAVRVLVAAQLVSDFVFLALLLHTRH